MAEKPTYDALEQRITLLEQNLAQQKRFEEINRTLFQISNAVNMTSSLNELFRTIHAALSPILDTTNFFIAIYDEITDSVTFPYCIDSVDDCYPPVIEISKTESLTAEVIRTGRPVMVTKAEILSQRAKSGLIIPACTPSEIWLGVPLKTRDKIIGVMAVQSYNDPTCYDQTDMDVLVSVADQVAIVIERKQAEKALQQAHDKLEQRVAERTEKLHQANADLQAEIIERKKVEEALRASEEKYRTVAGFTYNWEAWRAPDGTYWYISPSCERITGHTVAEFLADPNLVVKITHPDDRSKVISHIHADVHAGHKQDMDLDFRILTPSGEIRWISHMCTAVFGENGQWLGRRESNRNITDRKLAEAEKVKVEAQNWQLQKTESLGRMAGAIAHQFNNHFQAMMGNLEMAMDGLRLGKNPIERLVATMNAVRKASEVSSLMLTYLGQAAGERAPLDLSGTCLRSLPLIQAAAPKNMFIKSDFPASGPIIRANAGHILHVLTNLITNAWESSDENRRGICLTVKTVSRTNIPASKRFPVEWQPLESAYACIEVSDAGCGIAENDFEKIFDPFFSTKFTGRGLGLPVVLGIVRAHNGAVTVESEPGKGSIFRVFFPAAREEIPILIEEAAQDPEITGAGTVLLVEDNDMVREMAADMLTHLGLKVVEAKDGVEAVDLFRQHRNEIRCVLSDLTMPRMDGWETLAALRKLSPDIPVILSSGYDEAQVMAGEHPEPPNAFLGKPYLLKDLRDILNRVLAQC